MESWQNDPPMAAPPDGAPAPTQEARTWGLFCHLSGLVMLLGVPSVAGPLVIWLIGRDKHPFVDDQGKEALNFHIALLIALVAAIAAWMVLGILTLGIGLFFLWILPVGVGVYGLVMTIIAAMKANQGEWYRYPVTYRFLK